MIQLVAKFPASADGVPFDSNVKILLNLNAVAYLVESTNEVVLVNGTIFKLCTSDMRNLISKLSKNDNND